MGEIVFDLIIKFFGTFVAIFGFAIVLGTPKKYLKQAAFVGGFSGMAYWACIHMGAGDVLASFVSALVAATLSHIFARIYKVPVTIFLVAGALPTVPGGGMYRTVYAFIKGNDALVTYNLTLTLQIACVMAIAVFLVDSVFNNRHLRLTLFEKNEQEDTMVYEDPEN